MEQTIILSPAYPLANDDHFESLRYVSDQAREEAGLPSDYPKIKPMVMR